MVDQIRPYEPDVVVVAGGEAEGDNTLRPHAAPTLAELHAGLPEARILVLPPLSALSPQPYWLFMHARVLEDASRRTGATFVDVEPIVANSSSYEAGDFTSAASHELASALVAAIA